MSVLEAELLTRKQGLVLGYIVSKGAAQMSMKNSADTETPIQIIPAKHVNSGHHLKPHSENNLGLN